MALQVNLGTVQVQKGLTTVRHEWKLLMTGTSGFVVGANVTWDAGAGTGTVGAWDPVTKVLHVARTSGSNPTAGTTVVQTGPSASATVSSIAPGSPPNWNAKVTLPAVATFERHYASYPVASVDYDSFVIVAPGPPAGYLGDNARVSEYGLNTDFTPLGLGIVRPGDVGATSIITRSMVRIDALLTKGSVDLGLSGNVNVTNGMDAFLTWGVENEDSGGFIAVPNQNITVPSGVSRLDVGVSVRLTAALAAGSNAIHVRLLKNASEIAQNTVYPLGIGCSLGRAGLVVAPTDTLSVKVSAAIAAGAPVIQAGSSTNFWARIAQVI